MIGYWIDNFHDPIDIVQPTLWRAADGALIGSKFMLCPQHTYE